MGSYVASGLELWGENDEAEPVKEDSQGDAEDAKVQQSAAAAGSARSAPAAEVPVTSASEVEHVALSSESSTSEEEGLTFAQAACVEVPEVDTQDSQPRQREVVREETKTMPEVGEDMEAVPGATVVRGEVEQDSLISVEAIPVEAGNVSQLPMLMH